MQRLIVPVLLATVLGSYASAQCFESSLGVLMPRGVNAPGVGDDFLFDLQPMNITFPMGGVAASYTHAHVGTNGVIFLTNGAASAATTTGYSGTAAAMVTALRGTAGQPPRISPYWRDLNMLAANGGGVFFNNTIAGKWVVTWKNAVHFGTTSPIFTLQAQIFADGSVRFFYNGTTQNTAVCPIVGLSQGNLVADPLATDLSAGSVGVSTTKIVYETFATASTFDLQNSSVTFTPNVGGGYDTTFGPCVPASHTAYGTGCVTVARSWYENFSTVGVNDLTGMTVTANQNGSGGYTVSTGALGTFNNPTSIGLALTDDSVSTQVLPFTFEFPGGSTTSVTIDSNGRVHLAGTGGSDFSPTVAEMLTSTTAMLCPGWQDNVPDGATNVNNVFFDVISATEVDITWVNVPAFNSAGISTYQVALIDNGTNDSVEFRYTALQNTATGGALVGFSTGTGSLDPGNRDLTAGSFSTAFPEAGPLTLTAAPVPLLGANVTWTVNNVRSNASLSAIFLSFGQTAPVAMNSIGFDSPGCFSHLDQSPLLGYGTLSTLLMLNPTDTYNVVMPLGAVWAGVDIYTQAASLAPLDVPSGVITSNGLRSRLQTF